MLLVYVANDVDPVFDPNPVRWRRYPTWPSSLPELLDRARSVSYLYQTTKLFRRMNELEMTASTSAPSEHYAACPLAGLAQGTAQVSRICAGSTDPVPAGHGIRLRRRVFPGHEGKRKSTPFRWGPRGKKYRPDNNTLAASIPTRPPGDISKSQLVAGTDSKSRLARDQGCPLK